MRRNVRYSEEVRERAMRLVRQVRSEYRSEWAAIVSVAGKIGCRPETLRRWIRRWELEGGDGSAPAAEARQRIRQLERENFELRRANEIMRKAAAFFAQAELDRQRK